MRLYRFIFLLAVVLISVPRLFAADSNFTKWWPQFQAAVAKADAETDESFLAGTPERVARVIERALTRPRPRPRYKVMPVSRLLPKLRGILGDRGFDAFLRTQIKPPGPDA